MVKKPNCSEDLSGTGFQPVHPWTSITAGVRRRNLPHIEDPSATYFVTFRVQGQIVLTEKARGVILDAIRHWHGTRIDLDAAVVMPNHVHLLFRVAPGSSLAQVLHSIKSYSANRINKLLRRSGTLWMDESFDHIVRDGPGYEEKMGYILFNPVKAGLAKVPEEYPWLLVRSTG